MISCNVSRVLEELLGPLGLAVNQDMEEGKLNKVLKSLGLRPGAGKPLDRCTSNSCFFSTIFF